MTDMNDRRDVFEKKFAHDADMMFKAEARACKTVGLWAASLLGITEDADANAYAKEVISANLDEPGFDDVKRKLEADFSQKGVTFDEATYNEKMDAAFEAAKRQIVEESDAA